jgi:hypothetical protein
VAEGGADPPGPIPNPVVKCRSAGEYCGGDPAGGEAAAGAARPSSPTRSSTRTRTQDPHTGAGAGRTAPWRGVEQWQLVGLITQRSEVRILPPLPNTSPPSTPLGGYSFTGSADLKKVRHDRVRKYQTP